MSRKNLLQILLLSLISASAFADSNPPPLRVGMPGKTPGEIIAPLEDVQIAAWCDFSKQIVVTKTAVLCAYIGNQAAASHRMTSASDEAMNTLAAAKKHPALPKDLNPTLYEMNEYGDA